jgi:AAA domain
MKAAAKKIVFRLSELKEEPVDWLWPGRLALGKPTIIDGDPSLGKSLLTLDVAARLTTARPLPDGVVPTEPAAVVLVGSEDGLRDTVLPRLAAAGADTTRVHVFAGSARRGIWTGWPVFPADCRELTDTVREAGARLVVLDPLTAYLGSRAGSQSEGLVRRALVPLVRLAQESHPAMIWVRHLNKGRHGQMPLYRGSGSIAIAGLARTAFLVGKARDNAEVRVLASTKNNLATPPPSLGFRITANPCGQPTIVWLGPVEHQAEDLLGAPVAPGAAVERAREFLSNLLGGKICSAEEAQRRAQEAGIHDAALRRARRVLNVKARQVVVHGRRQWYWSLEDAPQLPLDTPEDHAQFVHQAAQRGLQFRERLARQARLLTEQARPGGNSDDSQLDRCEVDA